jgi:AraC-like DNA-binding protein
VHVRRYLPSPPLDRLVSHFTLVEVGDARGSDLALSEAILPEPSTVLGFQYQGRVRKHSEGGVELLAPAGVTGIQSTVRRYEYLESAGSILVHFRPDGGSILGVPLDALVDGNVALDDVLPGARVAAARDALLESRTDAERVAAIEALLYERLPMARRDPLVARGISLLGERVAAKPSEEPTVRALSRVLDLGERQLERRFRAQVGVGPKRLESLMRFHRLASLYAPMPREAALEGSDAPQPAFRSLAELSALGGYFDESHLSRELRRFAGTTPGRFFGVRR